MNAEQLYAIARAQVKQELLQEALEMGLDGSSLDDTFIDTDPQVQNDIAECMLSIAA
jgi:hypothetical protein